jgi:hypothetical protein
MGELGQQFESAWHQIEFAEGPPVLDRVLV